MSVSLIPSGQTSFPLVSGKAEKIEQLIVSTNPTDAVPTYGSGAVSADYINNELDYTLNTGDFALVHTTDVNPTTVQVDTMQVVTVSHYCVGTNSHSKFKGNMLIDGKVQVGNGVNGLESRLVENVVPQGYDIFAETSDFLLNVSLGEIVLYNGGSLNGIKGHIYKRLTGDSFGADISLYDFTNGGWEDLGVYMTPQNNPIALDNSNSSAYKHIPAIFADSDGMAHFGLFSQEMISNAGAYDGDDSEFTQLTNSTLVDDNGNTIITKVSSRPLNIYLGDD